MAIHALSFVLGVWLFQQMSFIPSCFWLLSFLPLGFAPVRFSAFKRFLMPILCIGLGFAWAALVAHNRLKDTLPLAWELKEIQVLGVVASLPQSLPNGSRFEFDVEQVLTPSAAVPRHILLSQYVDDFSKTANQKSRLIPFHAGERWRISVKLKRPHSLMNPHGFDFEAWALERNIRATGSVRIHPQNKRLTQFVWQPAYCVEAVREGIRYRMQRILQQRPYRGILQALVIGDEHSIQQADWQVFLRTGTNHLMSISGLHITMLSGFAFMLTMILWRRSQVLTLKLPARKAAAFVGLMVALLYALVAGFSVPTQRTVYMLLVFALALWSGRQTSIFNVLAYALFFVVLMDPWAVLSPGFWLSFGAVAVMAFALGGRLGRSNWLLATAKTQWVVTLGLVPFLLLWFQQVSLISPVANAIAIPVISLLVVPLALIGSIFSMNWVLLLSHWILAQTMAVLHWLAMLPVSVWQQHIPPTWSFILAMLGLMWLFLPKGFPLRFLGLTFCFPMFLMIPTQPLQGEMVVTVLDVGQGLALVLQTQHHVLLYDAGPKTSLESDAGERVILPHLRAEGIRKLDGMVISHNDNDHSGGMLSVINQVPTQWLLSSLPAEVDGVKNLKCAGDQYWQWDGVSFEVLGPAISTYAEDIKDNNRSCVLLVKSKYGSIILPGDIERDAEQALMESDAKRLSADVLVVPHHGSKTSSGPNFIDAVAPKIAIFTVGYRNRFGHPKEEVMQRYQSRKIQTYRSDQDGAVILSFMPKGMCVIRSRIGMRRYWHDGAS